MMTVAGLNTAIQGWIAAMVGASWTVIFDKQNAPRPAGKYITLRLASVHRIGRDVPLPPDEVTGIAEVVGNREWNLYIQAFGIDAMAILYDLQAAFNRPLALVSLLGADVVYVDDEGVLSITELFGSVYEERASLDVTLRTISSTLDVVLESVGVSYISSVNGLGTYHTLGTAINRLERALQIP
jgi:hypothetical protein